MPCPILLLTRKPLNKEFLVVYLKSLFNVLRLPPWLG